MSFQKYDKVNKIRQLIAGGTLWADCPLGTINAYGGATAPDGWLLCQGQAVSRTDYANLFAVIGTAFGSGDGSTTFNIPDLREATTKGAGTTTRTVGAHNAISVGDFVDDRVQSHAHDIVLSTYGTMQGHLAPLTTGNDMAALRASGAYAVKASSISSGRSGATTEVKSVGVNYIIKAKQSALPTDIGAALEELLADKDYLTFSD